MRYSKLNKNCDEKDAGAFRICMYFLNISRAEDDKHNNFDVLEQFTKESACKVHKVENSHKLIKPLKNITKES